jgi:ribosome recycling factor
MSDLADEILIDAEEKMDKAIHSTNYELNTVRTGRANPNILDSIQVLYYGCLTPLRQMASITCPEATQLYIKPFDKTSMKDIEKALSESNLGLTPQADATGIRLVFPKMTEERRKELVKVVNKMGEQGKVLVRNVRRDANDELKKLELPEDEEKDYLEQIQKLTDQKIVEVEKICEQKDKDLMTI